MTIPTLTMDDYAKVISEKKEACLKKGREELSDAEYAEFEQRISGVVQEIFKEIGTITFTSRSMTDIGTIVNGSLSKIDACANDFFSHRNVYQKDHLERTKQFSESKDKINKMDIPPKGEKKEEHSLGKSLESFLEDQGFKMGSSIVKKNLGKPVGLSYDMIIKAIKADIPEDSTSPWRDRILSAGVHIAIAEGIAKCIPPRLSSYMLISGIHGVGKIAKNMEDMLGNHPPNPEITSWWNKYAAQSKGVSAEETIESARSHLRAIHLPSVIIKTVHRECTDILGKIGNYLGLTDQNMALLAKNFFEFLAKNSPDAMEQKMWELVWEDYRNSSQ